MKNYLAAILLILSFNLMALTSDFYRRVKGFSLFAMVFQGDYYNPHTSLISFIRPSPAPEDGLKKMTFLWRLWFGMANMF